MLHAQGKTLNENTNKVTTKNKIYFLGKMTKHIVSDRFTERESTSRPIRKVSCDSLKNFHLGDKQTIHLKTTTRPLVSPPPSWNNIKNQNCLLKSEAIKWRAGFQIQTMFVIYHIFSGRFLWKYLLFSLQM